MKRPQIPCPSRAPAPLLDGRPCRSVCSAGRIVHFITGSEMDCHLCQGRGTIDDPDAFVCNDCGGSMRQEHPAWVSPRTFEDVNETVPYGLVDATVTGGYGSTHLLDMNTYEWSLCERCLRRMFDGFVVPPRLVSVLSDGESYAYADDQRTYRMGEWDRSGGKVAWANAGKCVGVFECPNTFTHRILISDSLDADDARCDAHKDLHLAMNVRAIPAAGFEGIPFFQYEGQPYPYTHAQRKQILEAWLAFVKGDSNRALYWQFTPALVHAFFQLEGMSGNRTHDTLWVSSEELQAEDHWLNIQDEAKYMGETPLSDYSVDVAGGALFVWPRGVVDFPLSKGADTPLEELPFRMPFAEELGWKYPFRKRDDYDLHNTADAADTESDPDPPPNDEETP